jgi:uncharacterized membrane protein
VKKLSAFVLNRLVAGALVVAPIYLAGLLLLKATTSLLGLLKPLAALLPESLPADQLVSLLFVLLMCFLIGLAIHAPMGRATWARIEKSLVDKIPGYALFRSLTDRLGEKNVDNAWKPALVEIEEAFVPAFIIEELEDGRFTVFVPSVPTPLAGSVYILTANRVHPLNIPFTQAIKAVSQWGSGSKHLVAAMEIGHKHETAA